MCLHHIEMSGEIKAIDSQSVHQICSGQVVLTLAVAVKEIVENSLDAGASQIDIRLKNYGAELIEVADNGSGVEETNFQALTLKHHTSKIKEFDDVVGVDTYGFRGEALSSMCALSNLKIITCHKSASVGTKLEYDHNGVITSKTSYPRQVGTTVQMANIFKSLPVRHKELHHNLKKEFNKLCHCLHGYCLVVPQIKFFVVNEDRQSKRSTVVSTQGNSSLKDNIMSIFGNSLMSSLLPFIQSSPSEELLLEFNLKGEQDVEGYSINGFISSCEHGKGRGAADKQFLSVNKRPCDMFKISKLINQIYHQFNRNQFPFYVLDISLNKEHLDVNITPDKRTVMIINETLLMAVIKASLVSMYDNSAGLMPNNASKTIPVQECVAPERQTGLFAYARGCKRSPEEPLIYRLAQHSKKQPKLDSFVKIFKVDDQKSQKEDNDFFIPKIMKLDDKTISNVSNVPDKDHGSDQEDSLDKSNNVMEVSPHVDIVEEYPKNTVQECPVSQLLNNCSDDVTVCSNKIAPNILREDLINGSDDDNCNAIKLEEKYIRTRPRLLTTIDFDLRTLKDRLSLRDDLDSSTPLNRRFRAKINPQDNNQAESELKKELKKELFSKMEVIGQFNLGFIIAKLNSDLFIIDQHASDEKFNYESLSKNTVLENQRLLMPIELSLTAIEENIIIEYMDIFKKNGFDFIVDETAECTRRIKLSSIPQSRSYSFGKEDIDELIFMLQDSPETRKNYRPSRVLAMFASRACRKSVMIGTALSQANMKTILNNMSEMLQPWNCPHGRPTIRHLVDLNLLVDIDRLRED